jgi:hypothetical protein
MIALTQSVHGDNWALVAIGQRFEFTGEWGPLIADMLNDQWPECEVCEDRACVFCQTCMHAGCNCTCEPEQEDEA